jgi:pyridoxine 5'-phosphate synthase PdxJ
VPFLGVHALVSDALLMGLAPVVRAYLEAMQAGESL